MSQPNDIKLYEKVKKEIYNKIPENSAYRSGLIVKTYKERGGTYSGQKKNQGLTRWYKENWQTQSGNKTYQNKGDIFRPTKRVNSKTPTTFSELSKSEIKNAQEEKKTKGRVKMFDSGK